MVGGEKGKLSYKLHRITATSNIQIMDPWSSPRYQVHQTISTYQNLVRAPTTTLGHQNALSSNVKVDTPTVCPYSRGKSIPLRMRTSKLYIWKHSQIGRGTQSKFSLLIDRLLMVRAPNEYEAFS